MSYNIASSPALSPNTSNKLISFLESFYRISDDESQHDAYVDSFTKDATLIMGPKSAKGSDGTQSYNEGVKGSLIND